MITDIVGVTSAMPKSLREFTAHDWRRLRPLTQAVKSQRYALLDRIYRRRPAASGDTAAVARSIRDRNVLVTIAFSDPTLISWQTRLVRHYIPAVLHVIVDNSSDDAAAEQIRRAADDEGVAYLRAPPNPWRGRSASRSHGTALNWTWHNVIRPGAPSAFGFIDHDIVPTAADDPFAPLAIQDIYGVVRYVGSRWFLWAGFCMFRFAAVKDKPLDFGQDWFLGLDTGGGNWKPLYSHLDLRDVQQRTTEFFPFKPGIATADGPLQWCESWLHEVGLMGDSRFSAEKRAAFARLLAPHLEAASASAMIVADARTGTR